MKPAANYYSSHKVLYYHKEISRVLGGGDIYPITVGICPANLCNQNCIWCTYYYWKTKDMMDGKAMLSSLESMAECGVKGVIFTGGGEPLMHKDVPAAIERTRKLGMEPALTTNGALLNEKTCRIVADSCTWVRISLDAATPETHKRIHRTHGNDFERIMDNIKELARLKENGSNVTLGAQLILHKSNINEIAILAKMLRETGADNLQIIPETKYEGMQVPPKFFGDALVRCRQAKKLENRVFRVFIRKIEDIMSPHTNYGRTYSRCYGHYFNTTIAADSNVYLCCHFMGMKEYSYGDLRKSSFREIWDSQRRKEVMKKLRLDKCPPLCRNHSLNKLMDGMTKPNEHGSFI